MAKNKLTKSEEKLARAMGLRPLEELSDEELRRAGFDPKDFEPFRNGTAPEQVTVILPKKRKNE